MNLSAAPQLLLQISPKFPILPPPATTLPVHCRHHHHPPPLRSHQNPQTTTNSSSSSMGIPIQHITTLAKFKSLHNHIRVLQISRAADHPLDGSRLLLLDAPGNIHSISFLFNPLTHAYFDVFSTLPPLLPPGPLAILGFGAGSAARLLLDLYPNLIIHGYELDPSVLAVAREFFNLDKIERKYSNRLFIHTGNALNASIPDGFAGLVIDLFSEGCVIPALQDVSTWEKLGKKLRKGGRMMVNVGGRCVEAEDIRKDGSLIMEETLTAMEEAFPGNVSVLSIDDREDESAVALTGRLPDGEKWKKAVKGPLKFYIDLWKPYG